MPSLFPHHPQVLQPRLMNRAESLKSILLLRETKCHRYVAEAAFQLLLPLQSAGIAGTSCSNSAGFFFFFQKINKGRLVNAASRKAGGGLPRALTLLGSPSAISSFLKRIGHCLERRDLTSHPGPKGSQPCDFEQITFFFHTSASSSIKYYYIGMVSSISSTCAGSSPASSGLHGPQFQEQSCPLQHHSCHLSFQHLYLILARIGLRHTKDRNTKTPPLPSPTPHQTPLHRILHQATCLSVTVQK